MYEKNSEITLYKKILVRSDSYAFVRNGLSCTKWSLFEMVFVRSDLTPNVHLSQNPPKLLIRIMSIYHGHITMLDRTNVHSFSRWNDRCTVRGPRHRWQILFWPQSPEFLSVGDLNIDKNSGACVLSSNYNATYILIEY